MNGLKIQGFLGIITLLIVGVKVKTPFLACFLAILAIFRQILGSEHEKSSGARRVFETHLSNNLHTLATMQEVRRIYPKIIEHLPKTLI